MIDKLDRETCQRMTIKELRSELLFQRWLAKNLSRKAGSERTLLVRRAEKQRKKKEEALERYMAGEITPKKYKQSTTCYVGSESIERRIKFLQENAEIALANCDLVEAWLGVRVGSIKTNKKYDPRK